MNWSELAEVALNVLLAIAVTGVFVCTVADVVWNRRHGRAPFRVAGSARGFGPGQHLDERRREGIGPHIAQRHRRAERFIRRGECAQSPRTALLVCRWAAQTYEHWENPWAAWNAVFLAPLFAGLLALTDRLIPETALVLAAGLLLPALAVPVHRVRVLRRSARAIETNLDLAARHEAPEEEPPPPRER
ncbi:ABC transporter permease [Nocardiopsis terrae]